MFNVLDSYVYESKPPHNHSHKGLAYIILEQLIEFRDRGIRLKHPIQIVADFINREVEGYEEFYRDEFICDLMKKTSEKLTKYYTCDELDRLCVSLMEARDNKIDERYIEIVSNH